MEEADGLVEALNARANWSITRKGGRQHNPPDGVLGLGHRAKHVSGAIHCRVDERFLQVTRQANSLAGSARF